MTDALAQKIAQLPLMPGVYRFLDSNGSIIYIGKANRLRERVSHYFGNSYREERKQSMIPRIVDMEYEVCETPVEALVREAHLIRRHQPIFNVEWKDGKRYFYLGITRETTPRIFITHQPTISSRRAWFVGPFIERAPLADLVRILIQIFGVVRVRRVDAKTIQPSATPRTREKIASIRSFLNKGITSLIELFEARMTAAAARREFERATYYRDKIRRLRRYQAQQKIALRLRLGEHQAMDGLFALQNVLKLSHLPRRIEAYDLATLHGDAATGAMVVALDGILAPTEYRQFKIKRTRGVNDVAMLEEVLRRRFQHAPPAGGWSCPDLVLVDGGVPQVATTMRLFTELKLNLPFIGLAKREERLVIPLRDASGRFRELVLPRNDRGLQLLQSLRDEAHRFCRRLHHSIRKRSLKS